MLVIELSAYSLAVSNEYISTRNLWPPRTEMQYKSPRDPDVY